MVSEKHEEKRETEGQEDEVDDVAQNILLCGEGSDLCQALMDRYARSSAPQHRHLCASAAAMRSILVEEGLPLTPPAYFAAAFTALRDSDRTDTDALAALAAFLSILLPLVPVHALPPQKAKDAVFVLASFMKDPSSNMTTGTVRSMIKSLGLLALRVDLEDWSAVELPLDMLLLFAVDRRPKVRRCAQVCAENIFKALQNCVLVKKASKVVLFVYKKYIPTANKLTSIEASDAPQIKLLSKPGDLEFLHILNILKLLTPSLSEKVKTIILSDVYKFLNGCFSCYTRHILNLLEGLFEHSKVQILVPESENIISALTTYISSGVKNPMDTVISTSTLLQKVLSKLCDAQPSIWVKNLPFVITSVAGLLVSDVNTSKHAAGILEELINMHIDQSNLQITASQSFNEEKKSTPEEIAVIAICKVFDNILGTCKVPSEYMLAVISALFLKLGDLSYIFMKEIVLQLSHWAMRVNEGNMKHLQECVGAAVIAMGPEKVLSLVPISLNAEKLTCSNAWLIPILKKYVVGASLQYFMDHIVPLAKSIQDVSDKVKQAQARKNLQSCACGLWNLLPAFCRYPTDTSLSFESLAKLLIVVLETEPSLHETVAIALQELVNENGTILRGNLDAKEHAEQPTSFILKIFHIELRSLPFHYSKKTTSRNMKALTSNSLGLFQTLTDVFFESPSEKRAYIKEAIRCLASIIGIDNLRNFFVSSLEKFESMDSLYASRKLEDKIQVPDKTEEGETTIQNKLEDRCLLMELASSFVEAADADLINLFFDYIRSSLMATEVTSQFEAYYTLSKILKEHSWFCSSRIDDLMDLLLSIKSSVDNMVLKNRLLCFHYLLVHMLKSNEDSMNTKAFLILNEIILTLKSKKESRKLAYDVLLATSCSLKNSESAKAESDLLRLFSMVLGYLSSSSPHIMSGAVSALSLLIYNDAHFCLAVPNLIASVLVLLQNKDNEVIKATLGFIKVLVSSLPTSDLLKLLPDIVNGILPWSAVSKHHFRSKVGIILEILIRKCGSDTLDTIVPGKHKVFVQKIAEARQCKKNPKGGINSDADAQPTDFVIGQKRVHQDVSVPQEKHSKAALRIQKEKRRKKHNEVDSRNNEASTTTGRGHSYQESLGADTSKSKTLFLKRSGSRDKRRRFNDRPMAGSRKKIQVKEDAKKFNDVTAAPKFAASSKYNKRKRFRNS